MLLAMQLEVSMARHTVGIALHLGPTMHRPYRGKCALSPGLSRHGGQKDSHACCQQASVPALVHSISSMAQPFLSAR